MKKVINVDEIVNKLKEQNNGWIKEVYLRNKYTLSNIALFYRGKNISYMELFNNIVSYKEFFESHNLKKGDTICICINNCPELVYILGAANLCGIKVNSYGEEFDADYIAEIIGSPDNKMNIISDDKLKHVGKIVNDCAFNYNYVLSLCDSLPNGKDPYYEIDKNFYDFNNHINEYSYLENIKNLRDFINYKEYNNNEINDIFGDCKANIMDDFTVTYSSGSTNSTHPKSIEHDNMSYNVSARFHDKDLSGLPSTKNIRILMVIPALSNTTLTSSLSDGLMQSCTVTLEPIYDKDFYINSLLINKPNFAPGTRSFWIETAKKILFDKKYKNVKMPYLLIPTEVGEPIAPNEEKLCNRALKKIKAGTKFLPVPSVMSIGGGDCEHGGFLFVLFKKYKDMIPNRYLKSFVSGLVPFKFADTKILNKDGNECPPYEVGILAANSPCTMTRYGNDEEATKRFFIKDSENNIYGNCNVYSYKDKYDDVHILGRVGNEVSLENGERFPLYVVNMAVLKDTKNILSCETVNVEGSIVINIELQPNLKKTKTDNILISLMCRITKYLPEELQSKIFIKLRSDDFPFPLSGCGKRNNLALIAEGIDEHTLYPVQIAKNDYIFEKQSNMILKLNKEELN